MILPIIEVAATVVRRKDGHVLLAERRPDQIAGGYWELPGGKIEPGETPERAAMRELAEEVGVTVSRLRAGPVHEHAFPTKRIRLHIFYADEWRGQPQGRERQRIAWSDVNHPVGPIIPSNARVLAALALPPVLASVSASRGESPSDILARCNAAFSDGARAMQFRAPQLAPDQRINLLRRLSESAGRHGARLFTVGTAIEVSRAGADGLHSTASQLRHLHQRPQVPLWSASCHDENDVALALQLGADFVIVSPVLASGSHPDIAPIGWQRFSAIAGHASVPVFAQGGMSADMLAPARDAGAAGIVMRPGPAQARRAA